jgi:TRAP-type C4-dicarboxylate transport system permease small subunit
MKSSATDYAGRGPLEISLCALLLAMVGMTFAQVLFRYVFQTSLAWSEELARFCLMWLASLSAAPRAWVERGSTAVVIAFLATFAWQAFKFTLEVRTMVAPATGISMAVPYSSACVGSLLMLYYVARRAWAGEPAAVEPAGKD